MKVLTSNTIKGSLMVTFLFFTSFVFSQSTPSQQPMSSNIEWMTWDQMIEAQKTERKKVFIDVYTDWCGWCKKMDASTFIDPNIVAVMNSGFYAVKLDAEMKENILFNNYTFTNPNPTGKRSTHQFAISLLDGQMSYPSFVILDENFTRQHIIKGFQQVEPLLGTLIFFKTNEFVRYNQYLQNQEKIRQAQQNANNQGAEN